MASVAEILERKFPGIGWTLDTTAADGKALSPAQQYASLSRDDGQPLPALVDIMAFEAEVDVALAVEAADAQRSAELDKDLLTFRYLDALNGEIEALRTAAGQSAPGAPGLANHDRLRTRLTEIRQA